MNTLSEAQTAFVEVDYARRVVMFFVAATPDEETTARYAANAFAFIINRNERITFDQFADRIQKQYSMDDPRTAECVRVLRACASYPVTAHHLGVDVLSEAQSIWLKTCFKAHMRESGIDADLPSDLLFASKQHVCEWAESCAEFEQDLADAQATTATVVPPDILAALQRFSTRKGRRWKSALLSLWESGRDEQETDGPLLRQMRNRFGPSFLVKMRLPVATAG